MAHKFDIEKVRLLDDPERREFLDPDVILGKLNLDIHSIFVDVGAGTGYFSIPASKLVKQVYALDILEEMLDIIREKITSGNIPNIKPIRSEESGFPIPDRIADVVFMANVFHELEDHGSLLKEVVRISSQHARLVIIDWKKEETPIGPPVEHRLAAGDVENILWKEGFEIIEISNAGPYNYMIISRLSRA